MFSCCCYFVCIFTLISLPAIFYHAQPLSSLQNGKSALVCKLIVFDLNICLIPQSIYSNVMKFVLKHSSRIYEPNLKNILYELNKKFVSKTLLRHLVQRLSFSGIFGPAFLILRYLIFHVWAYIAILLNHTIINFIGVSVVLFFVYFYYCYFFKVIFRYKDFKN